MLDIVCWFGDDRVVKAKKSKEILEQSCKDFFVLAELVLIEGLIIEKDNICTA